MEPLSWKAEQRADCRLITTMKEVKYVSYYRCGCRLWFRDLWPFDLADEKE